MRIYHASNMRVERPDTCHSRRELDFGCGFYVTTMRQQAEKYAQRFARRGEQAWLNVYELEDNLADWNIRRFDCYDEEWLDFVIECRRGVDDTGSYDMVVGGIADDKVFETVDLFFAGLLPKDEALRRLAFERPNIQYCIRNGAMLEECVTFIEAIRL
ncbi:MAG: DUF3990 domain-containing protein [Prevotella sp.]|nr:DUF3990 domain-containing protein [Prevotella sp.]